MALVDLSLDVAAARVAPVAPAENPTAERPIDFEELQRVATDLADGLAGTAERGSDGSAAWVGLAFDPSAGAPAIVPTDAGLYSGGAGIAIFLAAAAKATGREEFAELALATLAPHPRQSDAVAARAFRALPVGGYVGLASILYGWAAVGRLLDRRDLVEAAVERSALLTDQRVKAAVAGLRFEDAQFEPGRGNWPDRRGTVGGPGAGDTCSWCHGAPGIALARAALADLVPAAGEDRMLEAALATTRDCRLPGGHLCCGEAGIADVLLEVGRRRGRPELIDAARARWARPLAVWHSEGRVPLNPRAPKRAPVPGRMQGVAGVGLALLRASGAAPPSVLLLD